MIYLLAPRRALRRIDRISYTTCQNRLNTVQALPHERKCSGPHHPHKFDKDSFDNMSEPERRSLQSFTAPKEILDEFAELAEQDDEPDVFEAAAKTRQVAARQNDYQLRRFNREEGEGEDESYQERMRRNNLEREEERVRKYKDDLAAKEADERGVAVVEGMDLDKTPPTATL